MLLEHEVVHDAHVAMHIGTHGLWDVGTDYSMTGTLSLRLIKSSICFASRNSMLLRGNTVCSTAW